MLARRALSHLSQLTRCLPVLQAVLGLNSTYTEKTQKAQTETKVYNRRNKAQNPVPVALTLLGPNSRDPDRVTLGLFPTALSIRNCLGHKGAWNRTGHQLRD